MTGSDILNAVYDAANGWLKMGIQAGSAIIGKVRLVDSGGTEVTEATGHTVKASSAQLPTALAAGGGMKVEGVVGGVAQPVSLATAPALVAGEAHIGEVGGKGLQITVTPTLTVGATYAANDFVGTSATGMEFAGAARISGGTGRIIGAILHDYALASVAAELWLFTVTPAGLPADSAAFTITDNLTCIGVIPFSTYYASALNSIANGIIPNGQIPFKCAATSLFGALVTRGAPAYTNGLVSVSIFVDQD